MQIIAGCDEKMMFLLMLLITRASFWEVETGIAMVSKDGLRQDVRGNLVYKRTETALWSSCQRHERYELST